MLFATLIINVTTFSISCQTKYNSANSWLLQLTYPVHPWPGPHVILRVVHLMECWSLKSWDKLTLTATAATEDMVENSTLNRIESFVRSKQWHWFMCETRQKLRPLRQPPIVLRHFTFPKPECLVFHTDGEIIKEAIWSSASLLSNFETFWLISQWIIRNFQFSFVVA